MAELQWFRSFEIAQKCNERCIGFTFNNGDYVIFEGRVPVLFGQFLKNYFEEKQYDLIIEFSLSEGIQFHNTSDIDKSLRQFERYSGLVVKTPPAGSRVGESTEPHSPLELLKGIDRLLRQSIIKCAIIIKYCEHLVPNSPSCGGLSQNELVIVEEILSAWSADPVVQSSKNVVCALLREGYFSEAIRERWNIIRVEMPNYDQREAFSKLLISAREKSNREEFASLSQNLTLKEFSRLTSGLTLKAIERLLRRGSVEKDGRLTDRMIKETKKEEIRKMCGDLLEIYDTESGFENIGGMDYIKSYFGKLKKQMQLGNGSDLVRAILMVGVPGVGKSYSVRAFAHELGFNCVAMRNIRSMWVGESERNLERSFNAIESLAPTILFFDEIDQALGQRGAQGDSGVSQRMLARIWEFMAREELRGKVLFIAASNRPDMLDVATVDRFGVVIPFLLPNEQELKRLLPVLSGQLSITVEDKADYTELSRVLGQKRISPRQTLDVLSMARNLATEDELKKGVIKLESLEKAAKSFRSNANSLQIERITLEALRMTTFNELLPWYGQKEPICFPPFTESIICDNKTGEIDYDRLAERLEALKHILNMKGFS